MPRLLSTYVCNMQMSMNKKYAIFIVIGLVALSRIVPHPWNFTPIGAVGFLGAYYFRPWWVGMMLSFAAMMISDSVIGGYYWPILVSVYLGFALYAVWGRIASSSFPSPKVGEGRVGYEDTSANASQSSDLPFAPPTLGGERDGDVLPSIKRGLGGVSRGLLFTLFGSFIFFILTNSAVWLFGTMYSHTLDGLIAALVAGIPFYRNMLFGDILYIGMPLIVIEYVKMRHALKVQLSEGN